MSADAKPQQQLPFNLIPTGLEGVHSFVPPPKGTDLTKADRGTLLKHGLWMRRPDPDREPRLFAMWHRYVTEIWTEENFIPPVFQVTKDTPHNLKRGLRQPEGNPITSLGWSGVVVVGQWVGAMGMWQVPRVLPPKNPVPPSGVWQSSSWVGLDGAGGLVPGTTTTDVLQTGVSQNVGGHGRYKDVPAYYPWFEWFVTDYDAVSVEFPYVYPIIINTPEGVFRPIVRHGDEVSAIVQYVKYKGDDIANPDPGPGPYHFGGVMLTNVTTGKPICNVHLKPPTGALFAGESAEWIMECPNGGDQGTLPVFSSVTFRNAGACNVNDAPLAGDPGVALGNAPQVVFQDFQGNVETNVSASLATVTINYQS